MANVSGWERTGGGSLKGRHSAGASSRRGFGAVAGGSRGSLPLYSAFRGGGSSQGGTRSIRTGPVAALGPPWGYPLFPTGSLGTAAAVAGAPPSAATVVGTVLDGIFSAAAATVAASSVGAR